MFSDQMHKFDENYLLFCLTHILLRDLHIIEFKHNVNELLIIIIVKKRGKKESKELCLVRECSME